MEVFEGEGAEDPGEPVPQICCLPCGCKGYSGYSSMSGKDAKHYFN
jgi:hypothetical protein